MSYLVEFHPLVQNDYNEAYEWYENKQKGLGEKFLKAVRKKIQEISFHPETYGSKSQKKFREALVDIFPYHIVYKINKSMKKIFVSSIHHTKKHPRKKYRKE